MEGGRGLDTFLDSGVAKTKDCLIAAVKNTSILFATWLGMGLTALRMNFWTEIIREQTFVYVILGMNS